MSIMGGGKTCGKVVHQEGAKGLKEGWGGWGRE